MSGFSPTCFGLLACWRVYGRARWMISVFSLACLVLLTTSCAWWTVPANMHKIGEFGEKDFLKVERTGYKNSNTPPRSCLALSGGGNSIRSLQHRRLEGIASKWKTA